MRLTLHKTISVCSVYIPPSSALDIAELGNLIGQLPAPFVLLGDFNAHHNLWGCRDIDRKGRVMEDFLLQHNLSLFNDKSFTYLSPITGTYTSIDLTICDPNLYLDFSWEVEKDLH